MEQQVDKFWLNLQDFREAVGKSPQQEKLRKKLMQQLVYEFWGSVFQMLVNDANRSLIECNRFTLEFFQWLENNLHLFPYHNGDRGIHIAITQMVQQWRAFVQYPKVPCRKSQTFHEIYNFIQNYPWGDNGNYRSLSLYMWLRNNSLEQIAAKLFAGDSERAWQELQQANRIWKWAIHT